jgi:hypothetical protein
MSKISPFRKLKDITEDEMKTIFKMSRGLIWGDYNLEYGRKKGYIEKDVKLPSDYNKDFFVYMQEKDINGNKVKKDECFEGSQKRFIHWIEEIQV